MGEQLALATTQTSPDALLDGLDADQRQVALHDDGPCLVVAAAGSGKTSSVVHRLANLVAVRGVNPTRILCLTFTKKAAGEMATRAAKLLGHDRASVHTFHALCRKILIADWPGFNAWHLDGESRDDDSEEPKARVMTYRTIVKEAIGYKYLKWKQADLEELMSYVELCKAAGEPPGRLGAQRIAEKRFAARPIPGRDPNLTQRAYVIAEKLRREAFLMTFSDWMVETRDLLANNESVRAKWSGKFDYVMEDEHQDASKVQVQIGEMLAQDHRNLMVICDKIQSIYGWRGSAPELIDTFVETWKPRIIQLRNNYRSGASIVALGNEIRDTIKQSEATRLTAVGMRALPGIVRCVGYGTQEDEARGVARRIKELYADGGRYKEVFILYRTNAMSRAHEEALSATSVPYVVVGGSSFYSRKEVRSLCAYLRLATPGTARMDDLRRALREPNRFLPRALLDAAEAATNTAVAAMGKGGPAPAWSGIVASAATKVGLSGSQRAAIEDWGGLIDALRARVMDGEASSPAALLRTILDETDFISWIEREEGRDSVDNDRRSNIAELVRAAEAFPTSRELLTHVDHQIALRSKARKEDGADRVTLMSGHAAKGLEAKHVFLTTCNDRVFPHVLSDDIKEDRRLWYVCCSRARDELQISYIQQASSGGAIRTMSPSPFIPRGLLHGEERTR